MAKPGKRVRRKTEKKNVATGIAHIQATFNNTVITITDVDSPYTLLSTDDVILADSTNGNITVNLPLLSSAFVKEYVVKKMATGNTVTLDPNGSETIDSSLTEVISSLFTARRFLPGTSEWSIV